MLYSVFHPGSSAILAQKEDESEINDSALHYGISRWNDARIPTTITYPCTFSIITKSFTDAWCKTFCWDRYVVSFRMANSWVWMRAELMAEGHDDYEPSSTQHHIYTHTPTPTHTHITHIKALFNAHILLFQKALPMNNSIINCFNIELEG